MPARLTGRHFLARRETDSDCKVCSQHKRKREEEEEQEKKRSKVEDEEEQPVRETEEESEEAKGVNLPDSKEGEHSESKHCEQESGTARRKTLYYCKTCSGEPSLCPVPCFEIYHTRLIYRTAPEPETPGE